MEERQQRNGKTGGLLCPKCGLVQTHDRIFAMAAFGKVAGLGRRGKTNHEVYKGICLNCNSRMQAKLMLNEQLDSVSAGPPTIMQRQNEPSGLCISAGLCMDEKVDRTHNGVNTVKDNSGKSLVFTEVHEVVPPRQTEISDITMDQNEISTYREMTGRARNYVERGIQGTLEDIVEDDVQESGNNEGNKVQSRKILQYLPRRPLSSESQAHARTQSNESLYRNMKDSRQIRRHRRIKSSPITPGSGVPQALRKEQGIVRHMSNERETRNAQDGQHIQSNISTSLSFPGAHGKADDREEVYHTIFNKTGAFGEETNQGRIWRQHSSPENRCRTRNFNMGSADQNPPNRSMRAPIPVDHRMGNKKEVTSTIHMKKLDLCNDRGHSNQGDLQQPPSENDGHECISSNSMDQSKKRDGPVQANSSKIDSAPNTELCLSGNEGSEGSSFDETFDCSDAFSTVADCTSCSDILLEIYVRNTTSADNVIDALEKINELKPNQQMDEEWLKALFTIMASHKSNSRVQSQVFHTICSIISDNEHCIFDMAFDGSQASDIVHIMEMYVLNESVQEHLCNAIAAISMVQQHAMCFLEVSNGKVIQLLMDALHCPCRGGRVQENALQALFRLLSASFSADNNNEIVTTYLVNGSLIDSIVACIRGWPSSTSIEEKVGALLSDIIAPYSEKGTCESLRAFFVINTTPDITSDRIVDSRSVAVEAMRCYQYSPGVHEIACRVLATAYAKASNKETIWQDNVVAEDLELINSSLPVHIHHSANAASACTALHNFCALLSLSASSDVLGLVRSVTEVINVIENYRGNQQLLEAAVGALHALCSIRDELVIPFESDGTITSIVSAMNRFPSSVSLQRHSMGILWMYLSVSSMGLKFINDDLLLAVERSMTKDNEESDCETATNIMLALSNKGHQVEQIFFNNHHLIESVVECQFRWPNSVSIQGAAASILSNVALSQSTRKEICQMGGTSRVIAALKHLNHNPLLVCKALDSLANLLSGADVEILRSDDLPASEILVCAMKRHPQNICIQVKGANALRSILMRDARCKHDIVNLGGAEVIGEAMAEFLGSVQMLTKGSVALWALAGSSKTSKDERRKTRIGKCAIEPVVNGLSAHVAQGGITREGISSEETCLAALGCLKCLSTTPANKAVFEATSALDLIYSCIWQYYGNPQVCKEALAVLCNLSVKGTATNVVSEIKSDQLEAVVLAMRTHQVNETSTMEVNQAGRAVQENAIRLLRNSTFLLTNIIVLQQNADLSSLVRMAMPYLNDDCRDRAEDLLDVLSEQTDESTTCLEVGRGHFLVWLFGSRPVSAFLSQEQVVDLLNHLCFYPPMTIKLVPTI